VLENCQRRIYFASQYNLHALCVGIMSHRLCVDYFNKMPESVFVTIFNTHMGKIKLTKRQKFKKPNDSRQVNETHC